MMSPLRLLEQFTTPIVLSALMVTVPVPHSLVNAAEPRTPKVPTPSDTLQSAATAIQGLMTRYGCKIDRQQNAAFYPNHKATRYELAAALETCLDQAGRNLTPEDAAIAQKLQTEFKHEIANLNDKRSFAERLATLEAQQFSNDTKIDGEVVYGQFLDVNPTDWAYPSLKQLAERTGCLMGVPAFFEPQRSPTRLELAAGLNACLKTLEGRFPTKSDQVIAQNLQTELKAELKTLDDYINSLDDRTRSLEALRFSTTTKMQGQAVVTFQGGGLGR